jgi:mono/diheme cytochrome c family protein
VRRPAALIAVLLVAGGLAGCGGSGVSAPGEADPANGKKLFVSNCGNCHVLDDAGTLGTVGPNLDDAAAGSRIAGLKPSSFEALVRQQIDAAPPRFGRRRPRRGRLRGERRRCEARAGKQPGLDSAVAEG